MRALKQVKRIIIHCSDSPDRAKIKFKDVKRWHVEDNGWEDVGYHFGIERDGTLQRGRSRKHQGAHCFGHNYDSISICLIGRNQFTDAQLLTLRDWLIDMLDLYGITVNDVHAHYNFSKIKTCPNINIHLIRLLVLADSAFLNNLKGD